MYGLFGIPVYIWRAQRFSSQSDTEITIEYQFWKFIVWKELSELQYVELLVASCSRITSREERTADSARQLMELNRIKELIFMSSDIREDVVADLKAQILEGTYEIRPEHVVERIIWHGIYTRYIGGEWGMLSIASQNSLRKSEVAVKRLFRTVKIA